MNTPSEEQTRNALVTRGAELEQEQSSLHEELTKVRVERAPTVVGEEQTSPQTRTHPQRSSRRKMLTKGLGLAAVASAGAGALLELGGGTAAASSVKPGTFASSTAGTPAVKATGTNGADGVDASSDSGTGVSATSSSGTGLVAKSSSGLAGHFVGNVSIDNNLKVAGTLTGGVGTFASSVDTTSAVLGTGSNGATGVEGSTTNATAIYGHDGGVGNGVVGSSNSGIGVEAQSNSGIGLRADALSSGDGILAQTFNGNAIHGRIPSTGTGRAGFFEGDVQVNGNFAVTGTKNFVQAHPTDPSREIAYVALEGGEAGTYVRGTGQLQSGKAVLALPEHFGLVTAIEGLTIQLTPRGEWLQLYVVELDTAQLIVREAQGKSGAFDYFICGVRSGYEQYEVLRTRR